MQRSIRVAFKLQFAGCSSSSAKNALLNALSQLGKLSRRHVDRRPGPHRGEWTLHDSRQIDHGETHAETRIPTGGAAADAGLRRKTRIILVSLSDARSRVSPGSPSRPR